MKYKGIIFDLDDTLYDYKNLNENAIEYLCEHGARLTNISKEEFAEAFAWGRDETKKILKDNPSARNRLLYMQHALERLNKFSCAYALMLEEIYWNYMLEHMKLFDHALDVLKRIKQQGGKIAISTDLIAAIQFQKVRKLGIDSYIDVIVSSEEVGVEKPHKEMFVCCLQKMSLYAENCLMIGDSFKKDILGAGQVGMDTLLYGSKAENTKYAMNYYEVEKHIFE